jgi:hypothetical protein
MKITEEPQIHEKGTVLAQTVVFSPKKGETGLARKVRMSHSI